MKEEKKFQKKVKGFLISVLASSVVQIFIILFVSLYPLHMNFFFKLSAGFNMYVGLTAVQMLYYYWEENKQEKDL